ncbi:chloramphenicol-biosynthetic FADH2-dependent halogenase CmlS [Nocardia bovistercoris]|uniref:Chloramphenicol-biosynthetic FADH2-dependent halogenase CmlS n=1 Tax=Nocardia bovistercoris TaxID=2785916 RepID=A0A931IDN3_9NOCA|nr:chloramphenicol-biosynthetic FADH2-dependent halogenase CmlS [Nocardia bovistercoris]MBH0779261.1 chloramphenicol-biosynthetic FADH2-dependent halogenase CmlS [Nocardia bovistercoris]
MKRAKVLIIGGGPAGCIAGLALNGLGHEVEIFEKSRFPRYRIGESFLPGTLSILHRLGLSDALEAAEYVKKPSATFLWGRDQAPWTFSFNTPRTAPWVFDHSIQVDRGDFDKLLLDQARARGVVVHENALVENVDVDAADSVSLTARSGDESETHTGDFVIDAGGSGGPLARQLDVRRFDEFYKNFAVWSYFRRDDPFTGDLKGTTYSITFEDGWVWMIPLKGDIYSVGVVVDRSKVDEMRKVGREQFYRETLARCERAMEILDGATPYEEVRVVHDWSYDSEIFSGGRFFLCGDSACFTDPLFSQGVHLAAQSAVSAAASIDRITAHPDEQDAVHRWYNRSYQETYEQYHEFLASFYTFASFTEPESEFWLRRRIAESDDDRLERRGWFDKLIEKDQQNPDWSIGDFRDRASTMIAIGRHQRMELSDEFSDNELNPARVRWISELTKQLNRITRLEWNGGEVILADYYKVDPLSFRLEAKKVLANDKGQDMIKYTFDDEHLGIFTDLKEQETGYRALVKSLGDIGRKDVSSQIVIRLIEAGLITGYDKHGERVAIQDRLRFDGVGVEYEV